MSDPTLPASKKLDIRECPFCDGRNNHYTARCQPLEPEGWVCGCKDCGACGPIDDTEQLAIEAWNRREEELKDFC